MGWDGMLVLPLLCMERYCRWRVSRSQESQGDDRPPGGVEEMRIIRARDVSTIHSLYATQQNRKKSFSEFRAFSKRKLMISQILTSTNPNSPFHEAKHSSIFKAKTLYNTLIDACKNKIIHPPYGVFHPERLFPVRVPRSSSPAAH